MPTSQIKKPKYDNKRVRFLFTDEAHQLLDTLKMMSPQAHDMALRSFHCGLRGQGRSFFLPGGVDMSHGLVTLLNTKSERTRPLSMTADVKQMFTGIGPGRRCHGGNIPEGGHHDKDYEYQTKRRHLNDNRKTKY